MENVLEVDFRTYAMSVVDYLGVDLNNISVFDFYTSINYLRDKFKKEK